MSKQEGVIQFNLSHQNTDALHYSEINALIKTHQHMHKLGLIDQDPLRYDGYAFGNISHRLTNNEFIISGTQTGGISHLTAQHYAQVILCDISNNFVQSRGPIKPSSECMSHAAIYSAAPNVNAIIHIHNPDIWRQHQALQLVTTAQNIDYGTPQMALAIQACAKTTQTCIAMLGHLDGVICFAPDLKTVDQHTTHLYQQAQSLI